MTKSIKPSIVHDEPLTNPVYERYSTATTKNMNRANIVITNLWERGTYALIGVMVIKISSKSHKDHKPHTVLTTTKRSKKK